MIKPYYLVLILLTLSFSSCDSQRNVDFKIKNNTGSQVDSLVIEPNKNEDKIISLKPDQELDYQIDMSHAEPTDGAYIISYVANGEQRRQPFGYYSNGNPASSSFELTIQQDSLLIKEKH